MKNKLTSILLSFILLFGQTSQAQSLCSDLFLVTASNEQRITDWVAIKKEISKVVGFEIKLKTQMSEGLVEIYAENAQGAKAVELSVSYSARKKTLAIEYIVTDPFKKRGLAQKLIQAAFVLFGPIDIIAVPSLVRDNETALLDFLNQGYTQENATKETPLYKALVRLGYSEIIPGSLNTEGGFAVRRPIP